VGGAGAESGAADRADTDAGATAATTTKEEAGAGSYRRPSDADTPPGGGPRWRGFGASLARRWGTQYPPPTGHGDGRGWAPRPGHH
jgi:hypothetical protein